MNIVKSNLRNLNYAFKKLNVLDSKLVEDGSFVDEKIVILKNQLMELKKSREGIKKEIVYSKKSIAKVASKVGGLRKRLRA